MVACVKVSTHLNRELLILIWQDSVRVHTVLVSVVKIVKCKCTSLEHDMWIGQRNMLAVVFSAASIMQSEHVWAAF